MNPEGRMELAGFDRSHTVALHLRQPAHSFYPFPHLQRASSCWVLHEIGHEPGPQHDGVLLRTPVFVRYSQSLLEHLATSKILRRQQHSCQPHVLRLRPTKPSPIRRVYFSTRCRSKIWVYFRSRTPLVYEANWGMHVDSIPSKIITPTHAMPIARLPHRVLLRTPTLTLHHRQHEGSDDGHHHQVWRKKQTLQGGSGGHQRY